jgi:phosphoribosylpyrophosphate synthetase
MGVPLTPINIKRFADGEIYVQILESIRGAYFGETGKLGS